MSPPSLKVLIVGHPLVLLLLMGGAAYLGWLCYLNATNGTIGMALAGWWAAWQSMKDFDHRRRYRAWRRDWMAMAGQTPARRAGVRSLLLGSIVLIGMLGYLVSQSTHPDQALGVTAEVGGVVAGGLVALALVVALIRLIWRRLRRNRLNQNRAVTVVVGKPILSVPPLAEAYRSVPSYCQPLLKGRL